MTVHACSGRTHGPATAPSSKRSPHAGASRCSLLSARGLLALLALLAWAIGAAADPSPGLRLPLNCRPGEDCWIVNHFDHGAGDWPRDFRCGHMTYRGHDGIDFAVRDLGRVRDGVEVLAAADGRVRAVRDGMTDRQAGSDASSAAAAVRGVECGNGVLIDHADGWQTQYCHLRAGSVKVASGLPIAAGTPLGLVGMSGLTAFPHLHFALRRHGRNVDPFSPGGTSQDCRASDATAWLPDVADRLPYRTGMIFQFGVAAEPPSINAIREGRLADTGGAIPRTAPAIAAYVEIFGLVAGDRLELTITDPDGAVLAARTVEWSAPQARWTGFVGRPLGDKSWQPGRYLASVQLARPGPDQATEARTLAFEVD